MGRHMDHQSVMEWIAGYERSWRDGDLAALDGLFASDVRYLTSPYHEPLIGLDAVRAFWLDDEGQTFDVSAKPVAVDDDRAVVELTVIYGDPPRQEFRDLWVLHFDDAGLVDDFVEWPFWPGQRISPGDPGADTGTDTVELAVVGAHLAGQPLNHQLTDRDGVFVTRTTTAPTYRLFALDTTPPKPGLVRVDPTDASGSAVDVEVWRLGPAAFGSFVAAIPAPLGIGRVQLADGSEVSGFLCEPIAIEGAPDITSFGGWRAYLASASGDTD